MEDTVHETRLWPDTDEQLARIRIALVEYSARCTAVVREQTLLVPVLLTASCLISVIAYRILAQIVADDAPGLAVGIGLLAAALGVSLLKVRRRRRQINAYAGLVSVTLAGIENLTVRYGGYPAALGLMPGVQFLRRNKAHHYLVIAGRHDGFDFTVSRTDFMESDENEDRVVFTGIVVCFSLSQPFPDDFAAVPRDTASGTKPRKLPAGLFEITSTNLKARPTHLFLSGAPDAAAARLDRMIQVLDMLKLSWPQGVASIAVRLRDGFLLLPAEKTFLDLPDLHERLELERHVRPMLEELATILSAARMASRF